MSEEPLRQKVERLLDDNRALQDELTRTNSEVLQLTLELEEKADQQALLAAENRRNRNLLEAIFEADPAGLTVVTGPELRIVYCNPTYRFIAPHNGDDLVGQFYEKVWAGEDPTCCAEQVREVVVSGRPFQTLEFTRRFADGTIRNFTLQARRIDWDDQPAALVALWDTTEQKRIRDTLQENEEKFRTTLSSIGDAVIATDSQGKVTLLNPVAEQLTGWRQQKAAGQPLEQVFRMILEQTHAPVESPVGKVLQLGTVVSHIGDTALVSRDGEVIPIEDSAAPIRDASGQVVGVVMVFHDIREKRQAEETLVQLSRLIELSFEPIFTWDLEKGIQTWNQGCEQLYGYSREEAIGQESHKLLKTQFPIPPAELFDQLRRQGSWAGELRHTTKTGQAVILESRFQLVAVGNRELVLETNRDVTERKRAEITLKESEEKFSKAFRTSPACQLITRRSDGAIIDANASYEQLLGYRRLELIGQKTTELNVYLNSQERNRVLEILKKDGRVYNMEMALRNKSGNLVNILGSIEALTIGGEDYLLSTLIDITERKEKERELIQLNRTLKALAHSSQAMLHLNAEEGYLREVCRIITEDCGHAMVWVGYADNNPEKTVRPVMSYGFEEGYLDTLKITWADNERGRGPTGTAIRTGQVALCENMLTDPQFAPWREEALRRGYASSIVFPLMENRRAFGAISIYSHQPAPFSDKEIQLLQDLVNDLAYGILSLRARAAQEKANQALRESQQNQARIEVQHRLLEQREQERLQIARDIHDGPVQELTAASLTLQAILLDGPAQQRVYSLEGLQANLQAAISELRGYAQDLRPPVLSRFGLEKAIQAHLVDFREKHPELKIDFTSDQGSELLPEAIPVALYRIYQESLNNIVKHAQAGRIQIHLSQNSKQVTLEIQDNGNGFEIPQDWLELARQRHLGLVGMRERAEAVGGWLEVNSHPGEGAKIRVIVPI